MRNAKTLNQLLLFILVAAPVILLVLIFRSPARLIYDENNFYYNIQLLTNRGFTIDFLRTLRNQSPGPLYQFLYYLPFEHGVSSIIPYRIFNYIFLGGTIFLLYKLIEFETDEKPLLKSLLLFAIPLTWTTGGLALTEIPTFFFALLSLYVLKPALNGNKNTFLLFAISGLLLGLTIISRSPFLMIIPAAAFLFTRTKNINKTAMIPYFLLALLLPFAIFYVWKGLVPPGVQNIQSGLSPLFLAYTFGYTCLFIFIIYPGWFNLPRAYYIGLLGLLAVLFVLNLTIFKVSYMPMKSLNSVIPQSIYNPTESFLSILMPCIICCLCVLYVLSFGFQVRNNLSSPWRTFLLLTAILIAITTLKSAAQFSTRYPYQSFPFLLIFCAPHIKINKGLIVRASLGIIVGIISLLGYYQLHYK